MVWLVCLYLLSFGDFLYLAVTEKGESVYTQENPFENYAWHERRQEREKSKEESERKRATEMEENGGFRRITLRTIGTREIDCLRNCGCLCLMRTF